MRVVAWICIAAWIGCGDSQEELPVMGAVPAFVLRDQSGQEFSQQDLEGEVWVANFMFTTCPSTCPALTRAMADLGRRFKADEEFHLVSITVDPDHDTPDVLRDYGEQYEADPVQWSFLTGDDAEVRGAITEGFRLAMGERGNGGQHIDIVHAQHFVLVDQQNRIRGYYRSDEEGQAQLRTDVRRLLDS